MKKLRLRQLNQIANLGCVDTRKWGSQDSIPSPPRFRAHTHTLYPAAALHVLCLKKGSIKLVSDSVPSLPVKKELKARLLDRPGLYTEHKSLTLHSSHGIDCLCLSHQPVGAPRHELLASVPSVPGTCSMNTTVIS